MKPKAIFVGILSSIIFVFISHAQQDDFPVLKGPYLGQKPPGMTPEIFAPGIVSHQRSVNKRNSFIRLQATDLAPIRWTLNEGRIRLALGGVFDVPTTF